MSSVRCRSAIDSTRTGPVRSLRPNGSTSPGRTITSHLPSRQLPSLVPFLAFSGLPGVCLVVGSVVVLGLVAPGVGLDLGLGEPDGPAERDGVGVTDEPADVAPPAEQPAANTARANTVRT